MWGEWLPPNQAALIVPEHVYGEKSPMESSGTPSKGDINAQNSLPQNTQWTPGVLSRWQLKQQKAVEERET